MDTTWDSIVVGAGAAGLSAALVLGRARPRTLVIDAGRQSNRHTHGIGGLLGSDRRAPSDFYAAGRAELARYPTVELREGDVVGGRRDEDDFVLELGDGSTEVARRVLRPPAWSTGTRRSMGSRSAGVTRCSIARSATAGSTATSRSRCSTEAERSC